MNIDKRIFKTKKNLKDTLIQIISKRPFENITVKELCEAAHTSRITFYSHYHDKYELVDDLANDMIYIAQKEYSSLQLKNNTNKDPIISYCNFLECILNLYFKNLDFFSHMTSLENPYLNFSLYKYILKYLEMHTKKRSHTLKPKYSIKKTVGFLCYGIWGFISESFKEKYSFEQIKSEAKEILVKILEKEILTNNN